MPEKGKVLGVTEKSLAKNRGREENTTRGEEKGKSPVDKDFLT